MIVRRTHKHDPIAEFTDRATLERKIIQMDAVMYVRMSMYVCMYEYVASLAVSTPDANVSGDPQQQPHGSNHIHSRNVDWSLTFALSRHRTERVRISMMYGQSICC